jgi:acyl-CoA reductase-like NAD-dependent aldehyde dehydrogenase
MSSGVDVLLEVDDAAARAFLVGERGLSIDGRLDVPALSGERLSVIDPATEREIGTVGAGGAEDVDLAVRASRRAFDDGRWRSAAPLEKQRVLLKIADLIDDRRETFAQLETVDSGKPIAVSRAEVAVAAQRFRYYAGWPTKIYGDVNPGLDDVLTYALREPVGVCGLITPWNYPLLAATTKVAPALACGNSAVLKPAEQTPFTALLLAQVIAEAGVPDGVLNVVTGLGPAAGAALVRHPEVDKIAFTGSTAVGREIGTSTGGTFKRVSLELGGKNAHIILADAELDVAAPAAAAGIWMNSGQACGAGSRLLVQRSVFDQVVGQVVELSANVRVGPGLDPASTFGPLISDTQLARVSGYVSAGREEGARVIMGGTRRDRPGYFFEPTIFTDVDNAMRIAQEEIFGPVLCVLPFETPAEAITIANDCPYGLSAGVWTKDLALAHRMARELRVGKVWLNTYGTADVTVSYGGVKDSGYGREMGKYSLDLYTELKSVVARLS